MLINQVDPCPDIEDYQDIHVTFTDAAGIEWPGGYMAMVVPGRSGNWGPSVYRVTLPYRVADMYDPTNYKPGVATGVGVFRVSCTANGVVRQQYEPQNFTVTGPALQLDVLPAKVQRDGTVRIASVDSCAQGEQVMVRVNRSEYYDVSFTPAVNADLSWQIDVPIPARIRHPMSGQEIDFPLGFYQVTAWCYPNTQGVPTAHYGGSHLEVTLSSVPSFCANVLFVAVRGSGQEYKGETDLTVSPQLKKTYNAFHETLERRRTDAVKVLDYPALAVATLFENSGFFSAPREMIERNVPRYLEGKNVGVERLREVVRKSQHDCPGQAVALAGYSQGALVIHQLLQEAVSGDAVVRDAIKGVVLLGDPTRTDNTKVFDFGTAANKSMGMCQLLLPVVQCVAPNVLADVPAVFRPVTTSVCLSMDPVCDTSSLITSPDLVWTTNEGRAAMISMAELTHDSYWYAPSTTLAAKRTARFVLK